MFSYSIISIVSFVCVSLYVCECQTVSGTLASHISSAEGLFTPKKSVMYPKKGLGHLTPDFGLRFC